MVIIFIIISCSFPDCNTGMKIWDADKASHIVL